MSDSVDSGDRAGVARDPRRTFTRAEVWRAWELQGQVCNMCRRAIPFDLVHGDHIVAWIKGGPTTVANLRALCGSCNLRKGSGAQEVVAAWFDPAKMGLGSGELRGWQAEALPIVLAAIGEEPVLVEACPGAGKTTVRPGNRLPAGRGGRDFAGAGHRAHGGDR
jgi:hypothetical protein